MEQNNIVTNCGYDENDKYLGMDVLIFRGDSERNKENSSGINFTTELYKLKKNMV